MADTPAAYQTAMDQLRAERDAAVARANAAERQWAATAMTPDGGWHVAYERAAAQLAEVTAERDRLREEVATLAAELDGARSRLTMTTRDLDAAERAVVALKAIAHAIVNAAAKGAP